MFSTALNTLIIITLGLVSFGFYAGADQLKVLEVKEGMATVKVPEGQTLSTDQVLYTKQIATESKKAKRNGFATFYVSPNYSFNQSTYVTLLDIGLGKMISLPSLVPDGILEGEIGFDGSTYWGEEERFEWHFNIDLRAEVNFIRNDGINKVIPGLSLGVGTDYYVLSHIEGPMMDLNLAVYLKAFISKQLAFISNIKMSYIVLSDTEPLYALANGEYKEYGNNSYVKLKKDDTILSVSIGLRYYF